MTNEMLREVEHFLNSEGVLGCVVVASRFCRDCGGLDMVKRIVASISESQLSHRAEMWAKEGVEL